MTTQAKTIIVGQMLQTAEYAEKWLLRQGRYMEEMMTEGCDDLVEIIARQIASVESQM